MSQPFISVIVPLYNEERHVRGCAESLLRQDYPRDRYEILMVDNNSTDASAEIVRSIPGVELLSETTQGDFAARNHGIARARGDILAFTDSDTAPDEDWLTSIAKAFQDPEAGVLIGRLRFHGKSRWLRLLEDYEADKAEYIFGQDEPELYFGYTCNLAARRALFDRLGPFASVQRNADVVFVRRAVDTDGTRGVRYERDMSVLRLEITSVRDFFGKQMLYGRDYPRYAALAAARPLNMRERLAIFRRVVARRGHSFVDTAGLLGLLGVGAVCYDLSRWWAGRRGDRIAA